MIAHSPSVTTVIEAFRGAGCDCREKGSDFYKVYFFQEGSEPQPDTADSNPVVINGPKSGYARPEVDAHHLSANNATTARAIVETIKGAGDIDTCWPGGAEQRISTGTERPIVEGRPRVYKGNELAGTEQARWLAKGRLPRAAVSLLIGDEGIGKSLFWVWIAAAVTTGKPLPEFGIPARDPGNVTLVVTEEDWSQMTRPRLEAAGVDLARVSVICEDRDGTGSVEFPRDLDLVVESKPDLVVVDMWLDTVPGGVDVQKPQGARKALKGWRDVATDTDAAIMLLCHTNRAKSANARDRYGVTLELRKKARLTLFAQQDSDTGHLLVGVEKANTTGKTPAAEFVIESHQAFAATDEDDGTVGKLVYVGDSDKTADGAHRNSPVLLI